MNFMKLEVSFTIKKKGAKNGSIKDTVDLCRSTLNVGCCALSSMHSVSEGSAHECEDEDPIMEPRHNALEFILTHTLVQCT